MFTLSGGTAPLRAECGLDRLNQSSHRGRPALLALDAGCEWPQAQSRGGVWMNRPALPLGLGVQGRVKMWRMARHRSALAKRRGRSAPPLSVLTRSARMPWPRNQRSAQQEPGCGVLALVARHLVARHLDIGQTGCVIHRGMDPRHGPRTLSGWLPRGKGGGKLPAVGRVRPCSRRLDRGPPARPDERPREGRVPSYGTRAKALRSERVSLPLFRPCAIIPLCPRHLVEAGHGPWFGAVKPPAGPRRYAARPVVSRTGALPGGDHPHGAEERQSADIPIAHLKDRPRSFLAPLECGFGVRPGHADRSRAETEGRTPQDGRGSHWPAGSGAGRGSQVRWQRSGTHA